MVYCVVIIIILLLPIQLSAGTSYKQIKIGESSINIPAPTGYHEISELSPETFKLASSSTPSQNKLLAVFVSETDLGNIMKDKPVEFGRYMLLQTLRRTPLQQAEIPVMLLLA